MSSAVSPVSQCSVHVWLLQLVCPVQSPQTPNKPGADCTNNCWPGLILIPQSAVSSEWDGGSGRWEKCGEWEVGEMGRMVGGRNGEDGRWEKWREWEVGEMGRMGGDSYIFITRKFGRSGEVWVFFFIRCEFAQSGGDARNWQCGRWEELGDPGRDHSWILNNLKIGNTKKKKKKKFKFQNWNINIKNNKIKKL